MATKTRTQTVALSKNTHHYREMPRDLSVAFTPALQTGSKSHHSPPSHFRRESTAPPSLGNYRYNKLPTRFSPYARDAPPAIRPKTVNVVYAIHTSKDLPPYKSPADDLLPQIKDPTDLEGAPPDPEITKAHNALALAQAVRSTSHAHQVYLRTQIAEGEAVLAILRKRAEDAEMRLQQADSQLGTLRGHLHVRRVPVSGIVDEYMDEYNAIDRAYTQASSESGDDGEDGEVVNGGDDDVGDREDSGAEASGSGDEQ